MTIDPEAALRRIKPDRFATQLKARPATAPTIFETTSDETPVIVLDTNVYIAAVAGSLPEPVKRFVDSARPFHCSVCLGELMTGIGNANPKDHRWIQTRDIYVDVINAIPPDRHLTPDPQVWIEAGLIAGTLARTQGYRPDQRSACLNDALILLTAAKAGLPVLTGNRKDFDLIQQLAPHSRYIPF